MGLVDELLARWRRWGVVDDAGLDASSQFRKGSTAEVSSH